MEGMTMSNKSNILSLAKTLVEKDGLEQEAAENFVKTMFDIANEALQTDKQVKMRWLGTFKVLAVKDRESVDVNTGERIVIEGRDKISFTPDNILKEIVNKPFAQFDTVTLNDDVDFTEIDEKFARIEAGEYELEIENDMVPETGEKPEVKAEEQQEPLSEPEVEQQPEAASEPAPEVDSEVEPMPEMDSAEESVPEEDSETESLPEAEPETNSGPELKPEPEQDSKLEQDSVILPAPAMENSHKHAHVVIPRYVAVVACCLILALVGGLGWFAFNYGKMSAQRDYLAHQRDFLTTQLNDANKKAQQSSVNADTLSAIEDSVQQELKRKAQEDSARMAKVSEAIELKDSKTEEKKAEEKKVAVKEDAKPQKPEPAESYDKYDDDVRIRTGAYRIVGIAQTVKVKPGQTLNGISKTYLGPGMECYVEALNGTAQVTAGQDVKIPKLELKKKRRY